MFALRLVIRDARAFWGSTGCWQLMQYSCNLVCCACCLEAYPLPHLPACLATFRAPPCSWCTATCSASRPTSTSSARWLARAPRSLSWPSSSSASPCWAHTTHTTVCGEGVGRRLGLAAVTHTLGLPRQLTSSPLAPCSPTAATPAHLNEAVPSPCSCRRRHADLGGGAVCVDGGHCRLRVGRALQDHGRCVAGDAGLQMEPPCM